jgi:hypothetical protein
VDNDVIINPTAYDELRYDCVGGGSVNDDVSLLVYGPIDVPLGRVANMVTVLRMDKPPNGVMLIDDGM